MFLAFFIHYVNQYCFINCFNQVLLIVFFYQLQIYIMASSSSSVGNRVNTTSIDCDAKDDCQILQNPTIVSNTDVD